MSDEDFIEMFFADFEDGLQKCGKQYTRPADYLERGVRIINGIRNRTGNFSEGKTGAHYDYD